MTTSTATKKTPAKKTAPPKKTTAARKPAATKATVPAQVKPPAVSDQLQLVELPVDVLVPNIANVRRDIPVDDALRELADSIDAQGVLEPLIVHPHPDGAWLWVIIAGHRRHAAASLLTPAPALPCIVRPAYGSRADLIAAMLTENGKRQDLSPVEEAAAFETMSLEGLSDDEIGEKVAVPTRRVTARRKLLKLDDAQQEKLHQHQLNIAQAEALLEFRDDPAATARLEEALDRKGVFSFSDTLTPARADAEAKPKAEQVRQQLRQEGRLLVDAAPLPGGTWNYRLGATEKVPADVAAHDATDCQHLAAEVGYAGAITWYCLDPTVHGAPMPGQTDAVDEAAALQREKDAAALRAEAEERARACAAAQIGRLDVVRDLATGARSIGDDVYDRLVHWMINTEDRPDLELVPAILGLDLPEPVEPPTQPYDVQAWLVHHDAVAARDEDIKTRLGTLPARRALLAATASYIEAELASAGAWAPAQLAATPALEWLHLLGGPLAYEWSQWEGDRIDEADAYAQEQRSREAAEEVLRPVEDVPVKDDLL